MTYGKEGNIKQWGDHSKEIAQLTLKANALGFVIQEQAVLRKAIGYLDTKADRKLTAPPPQLQMNDAVHRVKTYMYQLSHNVFDQCRKEVHVRMYSTDSHNKWVVPLAVRLLHLTRGVIPLEKASAIGGLVVALSASKRASFYKLVVSDTLQF